MDTTLQVIIGTLSGFVVAFFAEPIKASVMNQFRRSDLRKALYLETFANYLWFQRTRQKPFKKTAVPTLRAPGFGARTECMKHALSEELVLFYQLDEAPDLLVLYSCLEAILDSSNFKPGEKKRHDVGPTIGSYLKIFEGSMADGSLDKALMEKIMPGSGKMIGHLGPAQGHDVGPTKK